MIHEIEGGRWQHAGEKELEIEYTEVKDRPNLQYPSRLQLSTVTIAI